jgi:hypothetical protein
MVGTGSGHEDGDVVSRGVRGRMVGSWSAGLFGQPCVELGLRRSFGGLVHDVVVVFLFVSRRQRLDLLVAGWRQRRRLAAGGVGGLPARDGHRCDDLWRPTPHVGAMQHCFRGLH